MSNGTLLGATGTQLALLKGGGRSRRLARKLDRPIQKYGGQTAIMDGRIAIQKQTSTGNCYITAQRRVFQLRRPGLRDAWHLGFADVARIRESSRLDRNRAPRSRPTFPVPKSESFQIWRAARSCQPRRHGSDSAIIILVANAEGVELGRDTAFDPR